MNLKSVSGKNWLFKDFSSSDITKYFFGFGGRI